MKKITVTLLALLLFFMLCFKNTIAQDYIISKNEDLKSSKKVIVKYGIASFYAKKFNGRKTYDGSIFSSAKLTAACNVLPMGTWVKVTNLRNKKTVIVKINDHLHYKNKRLINLSKYAAKKLGFTSRGITKVKVEVLGKKYIAKVDDVEQVNELEIK